jgi:hypothetical protein
MFFFPLTSPSSQNLRSIHQWFSSNIHQPLLSQYQVNITLHPLSVSNPFKKPGPVFHAITEYAYHHNATFIYRINDDTEFYTLWVSSFIQQLTSLTVPYGVVGPSEKFISNRILTHDFVHRIHFEIFQGNYYPIELSDWWMDDWISRVYGVKRTFLLKSVQVKHHCYHHPKRYQVNSTHRTLLPLAIEKGKQMLRSYVRRYYQQQSDEQGELERQELKKEEEQRIKEFELTEEDQRFFPRLKFFTVID